MNETFQEQTNKNDTIPNGWYGWHEPSSWTTAPVVPIFIYNGVPVAVLKANHKGFLHCVRRPNLLFWIAGQEPLKAGYDVTKGI